MDLDSSSEKMAEVKSDVAYFSPGRIRKLEERLSFLRGQNVMALYVLDEFVESYFTNNKGVVTKGWLLRSDLIMIE
jgi:hypothetical protein